MSPQSTEEAAAFVFQSLNPAGYAKANYPPQIGEQKEIVFRDPKMAEKVLADYAASNLANVVLALSLNANAFSETKVFRHFFAHRAKNTFDEVQVIAAKFGSVGAERPEVLLTRGRPGTGVRLIDGWIADVENFFDLAS